MMYCNDAVGCKSHNSKAKKQQIYPFMTWVKWPTDLCAEKFEDIFFCHGRKNKTGKNVDVLNLMRNPKLCSQHLHKEKIGIDGYASGDPLCFAWNSQRRY